MERMQLTTSRIVRDNINIREDGSVLISGYACHFGVPNHNGEIVNSNSFDRFLSELGEGGLMPAMNYQHDGMSICGGWDRIEVKDEGLWVEGHLNTEVALVRDTVLPLLKSGDIQGFSTEGFTLNNDIEVTDDGYLLLKDFTLLGIALVANVPADFDAKISVNHINESKKAKSGIGSVIASL